MRPDPTKTLSSEVLSECDGYLQVVEGYAIEGARTTFEYLYGRCDEFAVAASRALGLELVLLIDADPYDERMNPLPHPVLCHAGCTVPGQADMLLDARGLIHIDTVVGEYCFSCVSGHEVLKSDVAWDFLSRFLPTAFMPGEQEALASHVHSMKASGLFEPVVEDE